jgi:CheY-like chemotaxis protein
MRDRELNILLVDDDQVDVMTVQRAFEKSQIDDPVHIAANGVEALQKLRDGSIPASRRLVLLDVNMPKMNGIEFLEQLRADPALQATSVVVLTTSNAERDKQDAYRLNVAGYLLKPVVFASFVDLMATLHRYWTHAEMT